MLRHLVCAKSHVRRSRKWALEATALYIMSAYNNMRNDKKTRTGPFKFRGPEPLSATRLLAGRVGSAPLPRYPIADPAMPVRLTGLVARPACCTVTCDPLGGGAPGIS